MKLLAAYNAEGKTLEMLVLHAAEVLCYKTTWWVEVREVQGAEKATDCQVLLTTIHCRNQGSCQVPQHSRTVKEGPFFFQWDCSSNIN